MAVDAGIVIIDMRVKILFGENVDARVTFQTERFDTSSDGK